MKNPLLAPAIALTIIATAAHAGSRIDATDSKTSQPIVTPFDAGRHELQIGTGVFFSIQATSPKRPQINDAAETVRFGWMLSTPAGGGLLRGNTEFLVSAYGSAIFKGPGSVLAGGALTLRRNFVQPASRWVPYFQIEAGALYTDAYHDEPQRALGQAFEFQLRSGVGLRFFLKDGCALFVEADCRHISNAGLADRNLGTNAVGGYLGISWLY